MQSNVSRVVVGLVVLVVAVVLFIALRDNGGDSDTSTNTSTTTSTTKAPADSADANAPETANPAKQPIPRIVIKGGKPIGGIADLTYSEGDRVRFEVDSDVSDEIHIHGYNLAMDIEAGGSASFNFPAGITGIFEIELENRAEPIAELRVNP